MTDDEKELCEAAAKGVTDSVLEPIKKPLLNIAEPFTKEVGLLLALPVKWWRFKYSFEIMQRAKKFLDEKGVKAQPVSLKLLAPILEQGCLEEDDSMVDRWAALLAAAADPKSAQSVLPSFPEILRQLSAKEAAILDKLYGVFVVAGTKRQDLTTFFIPVEENFDNFSGDEFVIAFDNLKRLGLLKSFEGVDSPAMYPKNLVLTRFGLAFVSACRPPGMPSQLTIRNYVEAEHKWVTSTEPQKREQG